MDGTVPGITFDDDGVCNYCHQHDEFELKHPIGGFDRIAKNMNRCIVGVSGGLDSSYTLYLAKEKYHLDVLAVNFDNGFGTPVAAHNLEVVTEGLDVPLYTYHADKTLAYDSMLAFMRAGLPDIEAVTDISFVAALYKMASLTGYKNILIGSSFRTEGITPHGMFYFDAAYVHDVSAKHGKYGGKIRNPDLLWLKPWLKWIVADRIHRYTPLYYHDYVKDEAKDFLSDQFGWKWYDGHHRENVFTEFCNNYWLYKKFGIDLRKVEYSALIRTHQLDRDDALDKLSSPPKVDPTTFDRVEDALGISSIERILMVEGLRGSRDDYETYKPTFRKMAPLFWALARTDLVPRSFYEKYCRS
jgi:hypothetical protein